MRRGRRPGVRRRTSGRRSAPAAAEAAAQAVVHACRAAQCPEPGDPGFLLPAAATLAAMARWHAGGRGAEAAAARCGVLARCADSIRDQYPDVVAVLAGKRCETATT